ncbi:MAG: TIM barrel protein [Gemmatimonadales bacterium]|nr:TIM barrel protein [Gemmatimonadales bacterium]NIN10200.1 TIM barrel protein [Gemmatimonadales bacterium]NIN48956.1 TIM barrel protein [Gemmatimonadales bacterium]NIP06420.1 TIM barrel protein [Gemmatimonadales bacterium]NIQ98772.1 TIM barrel protein [Gemmatimonadales bacterium]
MTCRREFLKTIGAASLAGAGLAATGCGVPSTARRLDRIGIQLYTVRSSMQDSVERTLERVAQVGYDEVEFAGYFGRSAQQIRRVLDDTGLSAPATHTPVETLENEWEAAVDVAAVAGHQYLVVASIAPANRTSLDGYRSMADRFNRVAERAKAAGLTFGYHNHDFEFEPLEGRMPWDVLLEETDPALVKLELDLYWITKAGGDPFKYLTEHPGRFPLVHVKDMATDGSMVDVGAGTIDFAALFARSGQAGIKHYFVEHDNPGEPFQSLAASYRYLRNLEF